MCLKSWLEMCVSCDYKAPLVLYGDSVPPTLFLCDSPLPERERESMNKVSQGLDWDSESPSHRAVVLDLASASLFLFGTLRVRLSITLGFEPIKPWGSSEIPNL